MRHCAVEPRYNEGPGDWQNMIATTKFCYIKVFFPMFNYNQGIVKLRLHSGQYNLKVKDHDEDVFSDSDMEIPQDC